MTIVEVAQVGPGVAALIIASINAERLRRLRASLEGSGRA